MSKIKWLLTIILALIVGFAACFALYWFELLPWGPAEQAVSKSISPFTDIVGADVHDYRTYQVKITYVGMQKAPIPTLAFSSFYQPLDMSAFKPYYRDGIHYGNDDISVWSFNMSPEAMDRFVGTIPPMSTADIPDPKLSLMIMRDVGTEREKCFEALVSDANCYDLLYALRKSLEPVDPLVEPRNDLAIARVDQLSQILQVYPPLP